LVKGNEVYFLMARQRAEAAAGGAQSCRQSRRCSSSLARKISLAAQSGTCAARREIARVSDAIDRIHATLSSAELPLCGATRTGARARKRIQAMSDDIDLLPRAPLKWNSHQKPETGLTWGRAPAPRTPMTSIASGLAPSFDRNAESTRSWADRSGRSFGASVHAKPSIALRRVGNNGGPLVYPIRE
jgi:hypothetical protein